MSDDVDLKKVVNELGHAWEEFKSANEDNLKKRDVVIEEKLGRIDEVLHKNSEINEAKARLDEIEKKLNRPGAVGSGTADLSAEVKSFNVELKAHARAAGRTAPAEHDADAYLAYKAAFAKALRSDPRTLSSDEFKALSVGTDPDGGFVVPADMSGRVVTKIYETSPMRAYADVQQISTDALEGLNDLGAATSGGWVAEKAARTETNTPQLGKWRIDVFEQYANPAATQSVLDDAAIDLESWLAGKVADIMGRTENTAFVSGNGVGRPRGFTAYTTAATVDASRDWGQFEHIVTGVNGAFAASNPADIFFELVGAFKDGMLDGNARIFTRREVVTLVRKFKESTTGNYLWQPGLQAGQPQQIIGFPVAIFQDMPALSSNSISLAMGNMRRAYTIVQRQGLRTLRDPYTNKPYVMFYTTARVGGGAIDFEALKFIKFST